MKKIIVLMLLSSTALAGLFDDEIIRIEDTYMQGKLLYSRTNNDLFSGVVIEEDRRGNVIRRAQYDDGRLDDVSQYFSKNGVVIKEENYDDGNLDGLTRLWYKDGILKQEVSYSDGEKDGETRMYRKDGTLKGILEIEEGTLVGLSGNYRDGSTQTESEYDDGILYVTEYYANAQVKTYMGTYKNMSKKHGSYKTYHEDGRPKLLANYKNNRFHGQHTEYMYDWDNKLSQREVSNYVDGKLHGKQFIYSVSNGKEYLKTIKGFKDDKPSKLEEKDDYWISYNPDGTVRK